MTPADLIATEERIASHWNAGDINGLTHMALSDDGEHEDMLCWFYEKEIGPEDFVFASHRAHYHALLTDSYTPNQLVERCLQGRSMALYGPRFVTSAIVAGVCGIAAGMALAFQQQGNGRKVFCFVGDGATDQGGFIEAVRFVEGRNLPCQFIVEDNNSSCGVSMEQRGMKDFGELPSCVLWWHYRLKYPHAGTGEKITLKNLSPHKPHTQ